MTDSSDQKKRTNRLLRNDNRKLAIEPLEDRRVLSTNAVPIDFGTPLSADIGVEGEVDCYSFFGEADTIYEIALDGAVLDQQDLQLFDENGLFFGFSSSADGFGPARIRYKAYESGNLFVETQSPDGAIGAYTITVNVVTDDHSEFFEEATPLNFSQSTPGMLDYSGDIDIFSFEATAGAVYDVSISAEGQDFFGEIGAPDSMEPIFFDQPNATWIAPDDGTYFITILDILTNDRGLPYTIQIDVIASMDDHGNAPSTATPVAIPSITSGQIEATGDRDFFVFSAEAGAIYNFTIGDELFALETVIYDRDGVTPLDTRFGEEAFGWEAPEDGDYFISFSSDIFFGERILYTLVIDATVDDHGGTNDDATPITLPATATGGVNFVFDNDVFAFEAKAGTVYRFTPSSTTSPSFDRLDFLIRDANGNGTGFENDITYWRAPTTSTYYLTAIGELVNQIAEGQNVPVMYAVDVREAGYFDDHSNTAGDATPLEVPSRTWGHRSEIGSDIDFFSFAAQAGTRYNFQSSGSGGISLFDSDGTTEIGVHSSPNTITWQADNAGTYFVAVEGILRDDRLFSYSVDIAIVNDVHGNASSEATPVGLPFTHRSAIDFSRDEDFFSFTATAGQLYTGFVVNRTNLKLFDTDGVTDLTLNTGSGEFHWIAPRDDVFYFRVAGDPGDYNVHVSSNDYVDDFPNLRSEATMIELPADIDGAIEVEGDRDLFVFQALAGTTYFLGFETEQGSFQQSFFNADGEPIDDGVEWTPETDQVVYVEVSERFSGGQIGDYQLHLLNTANDDHGNAAQDSTPISIGAITTGELETRYDRDVFSFEVNQGQTYFVEANQDIRFDFNLLGQSDQIQRLDARNFQSTGNVTAFVEVTSATSSSNPFTFSIQEAPSADDHGNTRETATAVGIPSTTSGYIGRGDGDADVFSFEATQDTLYVISLIDGSLDRPRWLLTDSSGTYLDGNFNRGSLIWSAPATETYFVEVVEFDSRDVGSFNLGIEVLTDDHGDTRDDATPITAPYTATGQTTGNDDVDWFSFEATEGMLFDLAFPRSGRLYDTDGVTRIFATDEWIAPASGTFFIEVPGSSSPSEYIIFLRPWTGPDDHANTSTGATTISAPAFVNGDIETDGDRDYFAFSATAGTFYSVFASRERFGYHNVAILDPQGQQVNNSTLRYSWTAPEDGIYNIAVTGVDAGYFLEVQTPQDDHGDSIDDASAITTPVIINGSFDFAGDRDYFSFTANEGTIYDINGTAYFRIEDENGQDALGRRFPDLFDSYSWRAPHDGTFFLHASSADFDAGVPYVLGIAENPVADDHGNRPSTATPLELPVEIQSELAVGVDADWFSFSANGDSAIELSLLPTGLPFRHATLSVADQHGTLSRTYVFNETSLSVVWVPPQAGEYFIKVTGNAQNGEVSSFNVGTYQLRATALADDHGNTIATATPIMVPAAENARLEFDQDVDVFRFTAAAGTVYEILANGQRATIFESVDSEKRVLAGGNSDYVAWIAPADGDYFVEVDFGIGDYVLNIIPLSYVDDYGNTLADATSIDRNAVVLGNFEVFGDVDFVKFTADAGESLLVSTVQSDVSLQLFDANGPIGDSFSNPSTFVVPEDGEYTIRIDESASSQATSYQLNIGTLDDDHANTIQGATPLTVPFELDAEMDYVGDIDYFSFTAEDGQSYVFRHRTLAALTHMRIVDDSGSVLLDMGRAGSQWSSYEWTAPSNGTYLLDVRHVFPARGTPAPGNYQISATTSLGSDMHGDSLSDATQIEVPSSTNGAINTIEDEDYFVFSATSDKTYLITLQSNGLQTGELVMTDSETTSTVFTEQLVDGQAVAVEFTGPPRSRFGPVTKNYLLQFSGVSSSLGEYSLSIVEHQGTLPCDYVGDGDGCDINDLDALYAGAGGRPVSLDRIYEWLEQASDPANPMKADPNVVYKMGDTNLDGNVVTGDCGMLLNNFDMEAVGWRRGDLNGDGVVNSHDLGLMLNNFGFTSTDTSAAATWAMVEDDQEDDTTDELVDRVFAIDEQ